MVKVEISYEIISSEFDGLEVVVRKDANRYKLYIMYKLLAENGLVQFNFSEDNYYATFIDKNLERFIDGIGEGNYRKFVDGYLIEN